MRRALAGLLLLSLIAGQVRMIGALIGRYHARQQMHKQAESASPEDEANVQHLAFSRADRQSSNSSLVWVEEREFRYQGNLYDVVREEWRGDVWHVWAVHDRAEEHYLEVLDATTSSQMIKESAGSTDHRLPLLRPLALIPTGWTASAPPPPRVRSFPSLSFLSPTSPFLEVPHPPPWG